MAGSSNIDSEGGDNPVEINVVPMVDVIFCLCLFFMCSMHFKQLEGKVETWLPRDRGRNLPPPPLVLEEIRVFMRWTGTGTVRFVGNCGPSGSDAELMATIGGMCDDYRRAGRSGFPVLIDAGAEVPWRDVVHVLDLCQIASLDRIEFAAAVELPR